MGKGLDTINSIIQIVYKTAVNSKHGDGGRLPVTGSEQMISKVKPCFSGTYKSPWFTV